MPARLELSPAMLALLACDDPPTTATDELLARLANAGVDMIEPLLRVLSKDQVELAEDAEEAAHATAIYVAGPGLVLPVALKNEPAPAAAALKRILFHVERFDRLRRFRLAADDMRLVEKTALQLQDRDGEARLFEQVLETGLVVTYARPYLESNQAGIGRSWWPTDKADLEFHHYLIEELRHPYHAHFGRTPRRTLVDTTRLLGLDGPPTYAQSRWFLTDDELQRLADLARRQGERLEAEANRIGSELGEQREGPRPEALFIKRVSDDVGRDPQRPTEP